MSARNLPRSWRHRSRVVIARAICFAAAASTSRRPRVAAPAGRSIRAPSEAAGAAVCCAETPMVLRAVPVCCGSCSLAGHAGACSCAQASDSSAAEDAGPLGKPLGGVRARAPLQVRLACPDCAALAKFGAPCGRRAFTALLTRPGRETAPLNSRKRCAGAAAQAE